jgi:AraC-like DNA-binding protein
MDYEFFGGFTPRIVEVANRNDGVWEALDYRIMRERTGLHSLAYVYGGRGKLTFAGETQELSAGDLFQIWPGESMLITSSRNEPLHFYSFQFQYRTVVWDGGDMLVREAAGKLPLQLNKARAEQKPIESAFRKGYELWAEKDNGYDWYVKLQLLHIMELIHRHEASNEDGSTAEYAVRKAIQYMKSNFMVEFNRDQLAEHVSLSPGYFSVLFKEHTGVSPIRYLNKIKVDYAKELLRNTALPIKQIAEDSGFKDSFYFSRLFLKETGLSPRDFRKS